MLPTASWERVLDGVKYHASVYDAIRPSSKNRHTGFVQIVVRNSSEPVARKRIEQKLGIMLVGNEELVIYQITLRDGNFRLQAKGECATPHNSGIKGIVILDNKSEIVYSSPEHVIPFGGAINKGDTLDVDFSLSPYAMPEQIRWVLAK